MASTGVVGARELVAVLTEGAAQTELLVPIVVEKCAADLVAEVQKRANLPSSGPPGPRNITGDYVGSWSPPLPLMSTAETVSWSVGTDRPQANRLEYGFSGTDSIGRTFDQPPYPHMGPAADVIEPVFHAAMEAVAAKALLW